MRFREEQEVLAELLDEWYRLIGDFTEEANVLFTEKAQQYDQVSPVWHRIAWPEGFVQELRKKTDRLTQLLANYDPSAPHTYKQSDIDEELRDILNYARMMAAIGRMMAQRGGTSRTSE